jgi:hypothetical protein
MRIIFLNSWYARTGQEYFDFIDKNTAETDTFSLFEVDSNLFKHLSLILKDFTGIESHKNIGHHLNYDNATFVSNKCKIFNTKINFIEDPVLGGASLIEIDNFVLCGVHGLPQPGTKLDNPDRIRQSEEILEAVKDFSKPVIIGGDFNLMPDTKSIKIFEDRGYRNLIKEFDIKNTRNEVSWGQFNEQPDFEKQYFADYCFISPGVKVKNFEVPYNEVSDHLPLILDFEI